MKYGLLFAILLLFATGCGQSDPARHPMMLKGDQYRKEGNFELAEKFYLKFVEQRPDSALGHRTLATLYDESLADPAAAIREVSGKEIPAGFRIKVLESDPAYDATFVLPPAASGDVSDKELDGVTGGSLLCAFETCAANACGADK